jgi:hypothetical protein
MESTPPPSVPQVPQPSVPENFATIIRDMLTDLTTTFPEHKHKWSQWQSLPDGDTEYEKLYMYCLKLYPEHFFDILYQNDAKLFSPSKPIYFLPDVDFAALYHCEGVGEQTHKAIWNYLQLIMFCLVTSIQDKSVFGDHTASMFENFDEKDLMEKLGETMANMTDFFTSAANDKDDSSGKDTGDEDNDVPKDAGTDTGTGASASEKTKGMSIPNMEDMYEHLRGLFDGKIGKLAKELAEEISGDMSSILGDDFNDIKSTKDVLNHLMKDPSKIQGMVKTVGDKLNQKIQSGEISQEELMKEATDILGKMKGAAGGFDMDAIKEMIQRMGGKIPKNSRIDTNALSRMTEQQSMRERLKNRMLKKKAAEAEQIVRQMQAQAQAQAMSAVDQAAADAKLLAELGEEPITDTPKKKTNKKKGGKK